MQVDLSATGDKLPNAVVAFLTCEVPSPQMHFLDGVQHITTEGFSGHNDALIFLGED